MRGALMWLGVGVVLACTAPQAAPQTSAPPAATFAPFTPNPQEPWRLTAVAETEARAPVPTRRPTATLTRAQQFAQVDPRPLAADPNKFNGQSVTLYGKAITVEQQDTGTWLQLMAEVPERPGITESIIVMIQPKRSDILRGECYWVEGTGAGTQQVTRALTGAQSQAPVVRAQSVESIRACS